MKFEKKSERKNDPLSLSAIAKYIIQHTKFLTFLKL